MSNRFLVPGTFTALLLCAPSSFAAPVDDWGINLKAGSLGAGVELSKSLNDNFSVNLSFNAYNVKNTDNINGIDYDIKFDLESVGLLANYHPSGGVFRFTGGLMYDNNELKMLGKPTAGTTYTINGTNYTATQVGALDGKLTFNKAAPYFGIGWGNRPGEKWGFSADLGVLYQGSPDVSLTASGSVPGLAADLEEERQKAERDLSHYRWYPVLSLGVYFRF